jgi:exopolyphosphatase/guanosine-5'-triphosphate,3'-diphosphate pyrophosphatase
MTAPPGKDDAIVPRWEWRTFGERFGEAEGRFAALSPEREQESDEIYLVSLKSDASVKVRDGLMDVKPLQRIDSSGLEQWKPTMKAAFPLSADQVLAVTEALGTVPPPSPRAEYELDQLIDELVSPSPDLSAVRVRKRRAHYTIGGCMAELSEVSALEARRRTIGIESEDPDLVRATIRELGLESRANVSLPRELKALAAGARRYAAIDIGTNSVKFHVGEVRADGISQTIADRAVVTRLGEGFNETGRLGEEPIERTVAAVADIAEEARRIGVEAIAAVGTAVLRLAPNGSTLVEAVAERAHVEVGIIDGEEEARLAYIAAKSSLGLGSGSHTVFDTGGGSSQFTFGRNGRVDERFSVNVGAIRLTEQYGLSGEVTEDTLASAREAIAAALAVLEGRPVPDALVGMGGAVTNLAAVKLGLATYDPDAVHGSILDRAEVDRQIERYRARSAEQRRQIVGLQPGRAEVILGGACIVSTILAKLGRESFIVSDRGLRHGLLMERFGGAA